MIENWRRSGGADPMLLKLSDAIRTDYRGISDPEELAAGLAANYRDAQRPY